MSVREPADVAARREALDPTRSFIVQAPAGSGKTGLLTQRFLRLLAGVEAPEQIVAITFTKKAAAEMRNRILDALRDAADAADAAGAAAKMPPNNSVSDPDFGDFREVHRRQTRELAAAALARERALPPDQRWNLLANPQRLRIQTIDSFNAALTRQMPLLTRLGAQPAIVEDARDHLLEAARLALEPHDDITWGEAVKTLHGHLDGDLGRAQRLIASMLQSRDQWIWHLAEGQQGLSRADLEAALERAVREELAAVAAAFPADALATAMDLLQIAASNLALVAKDADNAGADAARAMVHAAELAAGGMTPTVDPATLPLWQGLSHLLLTGGGDLRSPKGVNVGLGFPADAPNKPHKLRLQELLGALADGPDGGERFAAALTRVRILPPTRYSDDHWKVLGAFVEVLRHAFAMLERVFQATGEVDFSEVALRALRALRDGELPTDLALALDHRIAHLLVDEFQDTSKNQLRLLERLTEGWADGDGRTLFVVGDPMQSIYRFRKAEVALFTQAMAHGIGSVRLAALTLTENFRSQRHLVDWTNATFRALFPTRADPANGAVPFAPATASHPPLDGPAVEVHPIFNTGDDADGDLEAAKVTALVQQALAQGHASVAILVSARTHLARIMPALKAAGITPRVTDIEPLGERPMVRDLTALTRALVHPGDRTAQLAVLRAPWCGLTLAELLDLAEKSGSDTELFSGIYRHPDPRLARVGRVMQAARAQHRRLPLARLVQGAWLALGGPACARDPEDLADARAYLTFLHDHDVAGDLDDPAALDALMQELHAPEAPDADPRVQVLTMHKAKGLEFDTVILPGLQRTLRADETALLRWLDRPSPDSVEGVDLLMAALAATGADRDPIYAYVGELARQQRAAEQLRQLYVATTRPKQRLHLVGAATIGKDGVKRPPTGSLLRAMWDVVAPAFESAAAEVAAPEDAHERTAEIPPQRFRRLPAAWRAPELPAPIAPRPRPDAVESAPYAPFEWTGQTARVTGIVVHRLLQRIAEDGLEHYAEPVLDRDPEEPDAVPPATVVDARTHAKRAARIATLWPAAEALLEREGLAAQERPKAMARVKDAIAHTLADPTGRWILSAHDAAGVESEFTAREDAGLRVSRIDRWFETRGVTVIVDYKSGEDADLAGYDAQLARYARVLARVRARPARALAYHPQTGELRALAEDET